MGNESEAFLAAVLCNVTEASVFEYTGCDVFPAGTIMQCSADIHGLKHRSSESEQPALGISVVLHTKFPAHVQTTVSVREAAF